MDIYCKRCGEPWEFDEVQHLGFSGEEKERFWKGQDCPHCHGKEVEKRPFRAQLASALHEVLGDDIDGLAAEMDDAEFLLGEDFWD